MTRLLIELDDAPEISNITPRQAKQAKYVIIFPIAGTLREMDAEMKNQPLQCAVTSRSGDTISLFA